MDDVEAYDGRLHNMRDFIYLDEMYSEGIYVTRLWEAIPRKDLLSPGGHDPGEWRKLPSVL